MPIMRRLGLTPGGGGGRCPDWGVNRAAELGAYIIDREKNKNADQLVRGLLAPRVSEQKRTNDDGSNSKLHNYYAGG